MNKANTVNHSIIPSSLTNQSSYNCISILEITTPNITKNKMIIKNKFSDNFIHFSLKWGNATLSLNLTPPKLADNYTYTTSIV